MLFYARNIPHLLLPILAVAICLSTATAQKSNSPSQLLERIHVQYDRVRDYQVDINATVDMERMQMPEMKARMYFKQPDKVHIESEGFAMLPRDAVSFRPTMFDSDQYDMVIQGTEKVRGHSCTKLKLLANSDTVRLQRVMLYVDTKRDLVLRMDADPGAGASATVEFVYTKVKGKYWLPKSISLEMDSPMSFRRPGVQRKKQSAAPAKAKITLTYSDYIVNKGIPDSRFQNNKTDAAK